MTVGDLIEELRKWPLSAPIHIDVSCSDVPLTGHLDDTAVEIGDDEKEVVEQLKTAFGKIVDDLGGWEGHRVVRGLDGVRWQSGFKAVALDAQSFKDSEQDEANWIEQETDTEPTT